MKPIISVVIATRERPALLCRCLRQLIDQSLDRSLYEIIVVTDGQDMATSIAVREWMATVPASPAVRCLSLAVKKGPAAARNAGWRIAAGELLVFTDDDCLPDHYFLENYQSAYKYSGRSIIAFSGRVVVPLPARPTDYARNVGQLATARFVTANCACTRIALDKVGGLDEAFTMAWREDSALEFALLENNIPIINVPVATVVHPVRPACWGACLREEKKNMFNALLYNKYPRLYQQYVGVHLPWYYYAMVLLPLAAAGAAFVDMSVLIVLLVLWGILLAWFSGKRLYGTSVSPGHVVEILYTSMIIPFLSIYWNWYGRIKFRSVSV